MTTVSDTFDIAVALRPNGGSATPSIQVAPSASLFAARLTSIDGPPAPAVGETLSVQFDPSDPDGINTDTLTYQWETSPGGVSAWSLVGTDPTFTVRSEDEGKLIRVIVRYKDLRNIDEVVTSESVSVPLVDNGDALFTISGTAAVGSILTASNTVVDPDGNGSFTYSWQSSVDGTTWIQVGSNSPSYQIASSDQGKQLRLQVNYIDGQNHQETVTVAAGTIPVPPPTLSTIGVSGLSVVLSFSSAITATTVPTSLFQVQTVSSTGTATNRTISSITVSPTDPTQLVLALTGTAPAPGVGLRVSYTDPAGDQVSGVIQGSSGSDVASFSNSFATNFTSTVSVTSLASQYLNLTLTGSSAINGTANAAANGITGNELANTLSGLAGDDRLIGNGGNDLLIGGAGADTMTGGSGSDTFRISPADSSLSAFDRITDFTIGTDQIDGPSAVTAANLRELGSVSNLTASAIQAVLTTANFALNGAATFSYNDPTQGTRTFLALNDGTAGFIANSDSIVEITGFSGALTSLSII